MKKDNLEKLIDGIEEELTDSTHTMYGKFVLGITLKVLDDRLWNIDTHQAQRCNDLQHKILKDTD